MGEKIKHLLKSLILPTLEVLSCMLSFRKRASRVSIATANRKREPVCYKTTLKEPCASTGARTPQGKPVLPEHPGVLRRATKGTVTIQHLQAAVPRKVEVRSWA